MEDFIATLPGKVIEEKASLLSEAATSKFPRIGESPAIHHASKNLAIKKHTPTRARSQETGQDEACIENIALAGGG